MKNKFYKVFVNIGGIDIISVTEKTIDDYRRYICGERASRIEMGFNTVLHDAILAAIDNGNYELVETESYGRVRA